MNQKRKQVIIKQDFQHKLILSSVLLTLIFLNVIIIAASLLEQSWGESVGVFSVFNLAIAAMEIVTLIIVFFVSRAVSFRIAGPVYAMERTIAAMGQGQLYQVLKLRPGDNFVEVSAELNQVMESYSARLGRAKQLATKLDQTLDNQESRALVEELAFFVTAREEATEEASRGARL